MLEDFIPSHAQRHQIKPPETAVKRSVCLYCSIWKHIRYQSYQDTRKLAPSLWCDLFYVLPDVCRWNTMDITVSTWQQRLMSQSAHLRVCRHYSVPQSITCWLYNHGTWQSLWYTTCSGVKEAIMFCLHKFDTWMLGVAIIKGSGELIRNTQRWTCGKMYTQTGNHANGLFPKIICESPQFSVPLQLHLLNCSMGADVCLRYFPIPTVIRKLIIGRLT